jgi:hypothetical protein
MEQKYVFDLHAENIEWLNNAGFFKDQQTILTNRLQEVASKNTAKAIQVQVEHFQNKLMLQRNQLDYLVHNIKQQENEVQATINANPTASDHRKMDDHVKLRDEVMTFEKLFRDLRTEMMEFFAKTL